MSIDDTRSRLTGITGTPVIWKVLIQTLTQKYPLAYRNIVPTRYTSIRSPCTANKWNDSTIPLISAIYDTFNKRRIFVVWKSARSPPPNGRSVLALNNARQWPFRVLFVAYPLLSSLFSPNNTCDMLLDAVRNTSIFNERKYRLVKLNGNYSHAANCSNSINLLLICWPIMDD